MKCKILIITLLFVAACCDSKTFGKCDLVKELLRQGFPKNKLADWICLVKYESNYRTNVIGPRNKNGSYDYGLFQINNKIWCRVGRRGGSCNVDCNSLLSDDITAASKCALKIYKSQGFAAWYGWKNNCQKTKPDISACLA